MKTFLINFIPLLVLQLLTSCGQGLFPDPSTGESQSEALLLEGISPLSASALGGTTLTISGKGFKEGVTVSLDGESCEPVAVLSSTSLTCVVPAHVAGTVSVVVSNSSGTPATLEEAFTYTVSTLAVQSFTALPNGFRVKFNLPLNVGNVTTPNLNLYASAAAGFGPADVTLVGQTVGTVAGSVVVDEDYTRVTFVRTGGLLLADEYTVTLRSAANGFKNDDGLLDGNSDDVAGDDYTKTFSSTSPVSGITLSLPDFMRAAGQDVIVPNTGTTLPLSLKNNSSTVLSGNSIAMELTYNPDLLTVVAATAGADAPGDAIVALDTSTVGVALITLSSTTGLDTAAGATDVLVHLTATVPVTAAYGATQILGFQDVTLGGAPATFSNDSAIHVVGHFGDTSRNTTYSATDSSLVGRIIAGVDAGFGNWGLIDPVIIADINASGAITNADQTFVSQAGVGIPVVHIPDIVVPSPTISTEP